MKTAYCISKQHLGSENSIGPENRPPVLSAHGAGARNGTGALDVQTKAVGCNLSLKLDAKGQSICEVLTAAAAAALILSHTTLVVVTDVKCPWR
jgi:hypothetical protein